MTDGTNSMVGTQSVLKLLVVQSDLDGDGGVDQTDKSGRYTDEVGGPSVRGACVTSTKRQKAWISAGFRLRGLSNLHIGNETATNDENRLLSDESLSVHEVNNVVEGVHVLVDFTALDDLPCHRDGVVVEVLVNGLLVDTGNV